MTNEPALITRSLAVSAAAHLLIFGTAFAFTHYGVALFRTGPSVITVSLVSEDRGGGDAGRSASRVQDAVAKPARADLPAETAPTQSPSSQSEAVHRERTGADAGQQAQGMANDQVQGGQGGRASGSAEGQAGEAPSGALFGYTSSEWQLLQTSLDRAKTYPRIARERGIEGTVLLRFRATPSGSIEQVDVVKSSGARILDEASVSTVYRAAPVPYVDGWVEVPMVYQLRKADGQ